MITKIILADDHSVFREGMRSLINKEADLEVIADAENGREAIELTRMHHPDLVIMDSSMPVLNGIEASRTIISEFPDIKILALSMHSDQLFIKKMLSAGVSGYLIKDCTFTELKTAIKTVLDNKIYLSPDLNSLVVSEFVYNLRIPTSHYTLTNREREILQLLAEGNSVKKIASMLFISTKTVESHRQQIMKKLEITNLPDLTKYAIREGLTTV